MENERPTLTLEPDKVQEAASAFNELTLDPFKKEDTELVEEKHIEPVVIDESMLSEEENKQVEEFAKQIDITDSTQVLQYGAAAQKAVADFSDQALQKVKTSDLGEIGGALSKLVTEIKSSTEPEKKGLAKLFGNGKKSFDAMVASYSKAEGNIDKITEALENHQVTLMKDIALFDKLYEVNLNYYKELTMYILAGKKALKEAREVTLVDLKKKAEETGEQEDAQKYNDYVTMCDRFEKKLNDLELTRMVSIQMGPQTRLLQNNDTQMLEKIQSSLINTIPLWKSQIVLALGVSNTANAVKAQSDVTNMTNELLKSNADKLKLATVETAKENERAIIDIETLKHTNEQLLSTLDEVMQISEEGKAKRREAEVELGKIEGELRSKLLELKGE